MKLVVDVDEADIGSVRLGQNATFAVDAYPGRVFESDVVSIGNLSQTSGGVVTYETVLRVHNPDLLLKPGMTATAAITVTHIADVVLVPNAALRFVPDEELATAESTATGRRGGLVGSLLPGPPRTQTSISTPIGETQRVWLLQDGGPVGVDVRVGATDGIQTAIVAGEVTAGARVIVDYATTGT
jgi:HlyD family secretion protein